MNELKKILETYQSQFSPVIRFNPLIDKIIALDFTDKNKDLTNEILADTQLFTLYINNKLKQGSANFGIGGYSEHRTIYSRSGLFDSVSADEEPRRLHLGIDIWGRPYTPVMAPLDGLVHSFAFNDQRGDYGATIILAHQLSGVSFFTLYGHLSLNSIRNLAEGESIKKGEIVGEFGIPAENGQWPPHLHLQVIHDLQGWKGDYPGVCKFSEKEKWLANCPDPDIILQMMRYASGH